MINECIKEHISEANNEHIWSLGSKSSEESICHEMNSERHMLIADCLKQSVDNDESEKDKLKKDDLKYDSKDENIIKVGDKLCRVFEIKITETLVRTVTCTASDKEEAMDRVIEKYKKGEIVLCAEDYSATEVEHELKF